MKKDHVLIPEPSSKFLKVECSECGEPQTVFSHASTTVTCNSCGNTLATPTGSLAQILGSAAESKEAAAATE